MTTAMRQIVLINTAHFFTHYCLLILPTAVLAMARPGGPFGESYAPILALATGMFVLYGLLSLPQGWLAQHFGRKALMVAFYLGTGLSLVATGFSSTPAMLGITLAVAGAFAAIYHPVGTAMLVEAAGERPGRAIGLNGVFGNVGTAAAPVLTAFIAQAWGWSAAFILPGLICAAVGLVYLREPSFDTSTAAASARPFPEIPPALVRRAVVVLMLIAVVSGLVFNAFTILLPKLMEERFATAPSLLPLVGALAFGATLCGAATQLTVGRLLDRLTIKRVFLPLAAISAPALALLAHAEGALVLVLAALAAAAIFGQVTVNETMVARYISPALRTKLYSIRFFVGFLGAAAAAPLVSFMHEISGSVGAALLVMAVFAVVTLGCALAFPDRREELQPELWADAVRLRPATQPAG